MISPSEQRVRRCGSTDAHHRLIDRNATYRTVQRRLQQFDRYFVTENARAGLRSTVVVIPVVVHIVLQDPDEVCDAQVHSQIAVLNEDYRRLNADASMVPPWFAGLAADARIQFQLAARTPDCRPTNGIDRVQTSQPLFVYDKTDPEAHDSNKVKFTDADGADAWPRDRYLNIWVCNIFNTDNQSIGGYSSFPGYVETVDGVVIDRASFGTMGTAQSPFDLGRTATHEIGHWLNLFHIWGDMSDVQTCNDDDSVSDTPGQYFFTYPCPATAKVFDPCSPAATSSTGIMFMNFMDYTPDDCMVMFTAGQVARMSATLFGARAAILGSDALIPPLASSTIPDLWSRNSPLDLGAEPDPSTVSPWASDDIWVRRQDDGVDVPEHENPVYRPVGMPPNHVYVRIRNRACVASSAARVKMYWAKASTGLSWPAPWDGSVTAPAVMGGLLGTVNIGPIPGSGFTIVSVPWSPPDPDDYASFGADRSHFCLLARIEEPGDANLGMAFPEGPDLYTNVVNNNNIAWKNVDIMTELPGGERRGAVSVVNPGRERATFALVFTEPRDVPQKALFAWGTLVVDLPAPLYQRWVDGGRLGSEIAEEAPGRLRLLKDGAAIEGLVLDPADPQTITIRAMPVSTDPPGFDVYSLDVAQWATDGSNTQIVGGMRFVIRTRDAGGLLS